MFLKKLLFAEGVNLDGRLLMTARTAGTARAGPLFPEGVVKQGSRRYNDADD